MIKPDRRIVDVHDGVGVAGGDVESAWPDGRPVDCLVADDVKHVYGPSARQRRRGPS